MRSHSRIFSKILVLAGLFLYAQTGWAAAKALIEMNGGKPSAGLASAWKKVKDGEYEFTLDTAQEVKKGVKVSPDIVKQSIEGKLGGSGVKVSAKGANAVAITYSGDETKFLDSIAKTKIRAGGDTELALESSVSEGGIRAAKGDRPANKDEVKAIVLKAENGIITAKVLDSKATQVKSGSIKIKAAAAPKPGSKIFFQPEKEEAGAWVPKAGSFVAP